VRLPEVHRLPVVLASQRVGISLTQEAHLIRFHQLIDRRRIGSEFLVVELQGALVLLPAMDRLHLFVALDGYGDLRRGNRQANQQDHREKNNRQQNISLLAFGFSIAHTANPDFEKSLTVLSLTVPSLTGF
jgi:hypothetical protein